MVFGTQKGGATRNKKNTREKKDRKKRAKTLGSGTWEGEKRQRKTQPRPKRRGVKAKGASTRARGEPVVK